MRTVFFDVDTQVDFLYPAGALYVPGAEQIVPTIKRLNQFAAGNGIPVISDMDAHAEDDPEFSDWPPHCVIGTLGQHKPGGTLLDKRVVISSKGGPLPSLDVEQILLEKQDLDCFTNPNLLALLEALGAERYVVYGVVTEYCVRRAAFGLLRMGGRVELLTDAVRTLKEEDGDRTLREFVARGGLLTRSAEVVGGD